MKRRIALLVVAIAAATATFLWFRASRADTTDDGRLAVSGTVEATEVRLGFPAAGRIEAIAVEEGDRVASGALLARLDAADLEARRAQAEARVAAATSLLHELRRGSRPEEVAQAAAAVAAAEERVADARRDRERNRTLYEGGAVSQEASQKSAAAAEIAEQQLQQAREQLRLVRAGPRRERIEAQDAQVREAVAAVESIDALLANTRIDAPIAGIVSRKHREPNETVSPGQPVVTLMNPADRWVRVYVPEHRLGAVRLGAPASIRSDTWPDKRYPGRVTWISQEAEFTPKNVQTAEERVKLVYAVKVAVAGDEQVELKPGMPVDVVIDAP